MNPQNYPPNYQQNLSPYKENPRFPFQIPQENQPSANQFPSFSYSRDSRDITPQNKQYPDYQAYDIEKKHQEDPLYYKQPSQPYYGGPYKRPVSQEFEQNPQKNQFMQPFAYENERKRMGMNEPGFPIPANYEYERRVTANFNKSPSRNVYNEGFAQNFPAENRGDFYDKPKMLAGNEGGGRDGSLYNSQLRMSQQLNYFDELSGFEKLFANHTVTMIPRFYNKGAHASDTEVFYEFFPGEIKERRHFPGPPLFFFSTKTDFCSKYCLTADCRPFNVMIRHPNGKEFLNITRECDCTFLCCRRPSLSVKYVEEGQVFDLGFITNPFVCLDYELHIFRPDKTPRFIVNSDCCTCNFYCCFHCEMCNKSSFSIRDYDYNPLEKIQFFTNYECCRPSISEKDHYVINFPRYSTREDRALLIACLIFIDFRYMSNAMDMH